MFFYAFKSFRADYMFNAAGIMFGNVSRYADMFGKETGKHFMAFKHLLCFGKADIGKHNIAACFHQNKVFAF